MLVKGSNISIESFDGGGDFTLCQQLVKSLLTREDLKDMTISTILLCITNNTLHKVLGLTNLVDIWDQLESRYKYESLISTLYLKKRLFDLQITKEANFSQHLDKFNKLRMELDSVEVKIKEEDKALLFVGLATFIF